MSINKKLIIVFAPALLVAGVALFIQIIKYEPLFPKIDKALLQTTSEFTIPIMPDDPIIGDKKAPITIIAFEDFSCASCVEHIAMLDAVQELYPGKIKIIWKGLSVTEFPYPSETAQKYGYCAYKQNKFDAFKEYAFLNMNNLSDQTLETIAEKIELDTKKLTECLQSTDVTLYLENTRNMARLLNIQAVPTFFINNIQIENPVTKDGWITLLGLKNTQ